MSDSDANACSMEVPPMLMPAPLLDAEYGMRA
jgi:hypothetical protein